MALMFRLHRAFLWMFASTVLVGGTASSLLITKMNPLVHVGVALVLASPWIGLAAYFLCARQTKPD